MWGGCRGLLTASLLTDQASGTSRRRLPAVSTVPTVYRRCHPPDSFATEARECGPGESGTSRPSAQGEGLTDDPDVTVSEPCHPK